VDLSDSYYDNGKQKIASTQVLIPTVSIATRSETVCFHQFGESMTTETFAAVH
jgi:hypothetical protein